VVKNLLAIVKEVNFVLDVAMPEQFGYLVSRPSLRLDHQNLPNIRSA
jgi:hypothetical protein